MRCIYVNDFGNETVLTYCNDNDFEYNVRVGTFVHVKMNGGISLYGIIDTINEDCVDVFVVDSTNIVSVPFDDIMDMIEVDG